MNAKVKSVLAIVFLVGGIIAAIWTGVYTYYAVIISILGRAYPEPEPWMVYYMLYYVIAAIIALSAMIAFFAFFARFRKSNKYLRKGRRH